MVPPRTCILRNDLNAAAIENYIHTKLNAVQDCLVRGREQGEEDLKEMYEEIQNELEKVAGLTGFCEKCGDQAKFCLGVGCDKCNLENISKGIVLLTGKYEFCRRVIVFYTVTKMGPVLDVSSDLPESLQD